LILSKRLSSASVSHVFLFSETSTPKYGVTCELAARSLQSCSLTSPLNSMLNINNGTVAPSCMRVDYKLSHDDVVLTADIFVGNDRVVSGVIFSASRKSNYISLSDLPSMDFSVTFTAKRVLTSEDKTESARIVLVKLAHCSDLCTYNHYDYGDACNDCADCDDDDNDELIIITCSLN